MIFFYRIEEDFSLKMISLMQKLTLYFFQGGLIIMSSSKTRFFNPAVVGLIMLSFFLGTSEYTVIGILPEIADGFGISLTQAGNIVSLFAFAYGLGTPFLAAYVGKYNRFRITMLGISLFALCAIAVNYMVFLVFRILTAVVSGTVVSISMTYAEDVASIPEHIPGVIAGVFSGFSVASVVGVPIASTITQVFGWRTAFITIFVATLALLALLFVKLPRQNRLKAGSILEQFKLFLDKRISIGCAIVFLAGASTYCFYTYLTPIFQQELHIPDSMLSVALLIFGIAAITSNVSSGQVANKTGIRLLPLIYVIQTVCLLLLPIATHNLVSGGLVLFILGVMMYLLNSPLQMHFLKIATREHPACVNLASSLISVFFNFGIAAGSAMGGVIVKYAGLRFVGIGGAVPGIGAIICAVILLQIMKPGADIR